MSLYVKKSTGHYTINIKPEKYANYSVFSVGYSKKNGNYNPKQFKFGIGQS